MINTSINGKQISWFGAIASYSDILVLFLGSKPKRKPISKQSATFEFSNDGKLIIDDEDDVTEKKESTGLDVGEKDILGGK